MLTYSYKVVTQGGEMVQGNLDATSQSDAIEKLQNANYIPISVEETSSKEEKSYLTFGWPRFRKGDLNTAHVVMLTRELATLLKAGLPLDKALQTLSDVSSTPQVSRIVNELYSRVQNGSSLSDAMASQGRGFNRLYLNVIRAGEAGGALDTVLQRLSDYLERNNEMRATIISALIYPIILVSVALISVIALMIIVVPQFIPLFEDAGQSLPYATQMVFSIAELFRQYWWVVPIVIVFSFWVFQTVMKDLVKQQQWDNFLMSIPIYGELVAKIEIARFARTLGTLLSNGVPLLTGVSITKEVINNKMILEIMDSVIKVLEQGGRLADVLSQAQYFPKLAIQLIRVGEETGQLESMLLKIADIYDKETNMLIKRILTLLEPVLILGLGGVIAIIIISILVAILSLNELVA